MSAVESNNNNQQHNTTSQPPPAPQVEPTLPIQPPSLDPCVHASHWKSLEQKVDELHLKLDKLSNIVNTLNERVQQIIEDNKDSKYDTVDIDNEEEDDEDEDDDDGGNKSAHRTSKHLTKRIVDMIIDSPMLNISWIPDEMERTLYETILSVITGILHL
jgi:hypothetical protein